MKDSLSGANWIKLDYSDGNSSRAVLFNDLTHFHGLIIGAPHKINTTGQIADVNLCLGFCDLAYYELLTTQVHYGVIS